ncbi:MAG: aryl-sulfate sulfotransferase, partial [Candidatus Heimdallarchaeaceae archaeon]
MYKSIQQCHKIRRILLFSFIVILFSNSLIYTEVGSNPNIALFELYDSQDITIHLQEQPMELDTSLNNFYENASFKAEYFGEPLESHILFTLEKRNLTTNNGIASLVAITDLNGTIIASKEIDQTRLNSLGLGISSCSAEMVNSTTVLYGNPNATLWNFETDTSVSLGFFGHHELEYISKRDTIFVIEQATRIIDDKLIVTDYINEYDLNSNLIWSLDSYDFVGSQKHCPFISYPDESLIDVTHGNTIFYDEEEDILYYNSRNLNTFYKIDYVTKDVIWSLGEYGDFTLYDKYGTIQSNLFYHAHSVEKTSEKTFVLFDNDRHNQTFAHSRTSRIIELVIDDTDMVANVSFTWEAPQSYWSSIWGDADMLPNGHFFGTFGTPTHIN